MLTPGSLVELVIEKPAVGGRMIARHEGQVVLVSAAIPGERVRALVERVTQGVGYAVAVDLIDASPVRRPAARDWACGGNVYAHIDYAAQLPIKGQVIADALQRIGRIPLEQPIPITGSPEEGYRMRARFHVRGQALGFFREGSHQLCDPASTRQLLPATNELVRELGERMASGALRGVTEIELAENVPASERALHFELDRPTTPMGLAEIAKLPTIVGVAASFGASAAPRRAPRGGGRPVPSSWRRTVTAGGTPCVLDTLTFQAAGSEHEVRLQHHAQAFFQGNRYLLASLASRVISLVSQGPVVDLYAGVGLFSASLAAAGWPSVTAVEGDRASAADLRANASPFGGSLNAVEAPVEHYLEEHPVGPEATIVVDPPRTGMSKQAAAAIAGQEARRLVYVSCDVATFARDSRRLLDAGYRLEHLEGFDLFPNTAHVEAIGVFGKE